MEQTVWKGQRWSAANAYLKPALKRDNCTLMRGLVSRVLITEGRATGIELQRGGRTEQITARREVILAASSINSPKLLMLSGIGPAAHLAEHAADPEVSTVAVVLAPTRSCMAGLSGRPSSRMRTGNRCVTRSAPHR